MVSGIPWGCWKVFPMNQGEILFKPLFPLPFWKGNLMVPYPLPFSTSFSFHFTGLYVSFHSGLKFVSCTFWRLANFYCPCLSVIQVFHCYMTISLSIFQLVDIWLVSMCWCYECFYKYSLWSLVYVTKRLFRVYT